MATWFPNWLITVGDDTYTTATSVSFSSGRVDIDRQCTAGYCLIELINTTGADFTISLTEPITLQLANSDGTYVTVWGGEVSDFGIGVKSPDETGFITTGTILGIGSLSKLAKAVYNTALAEGLDGAQIATILGSALNYSWSETNPTLTWDTYPATITWAEAESYVGTVDPGFYTMIPLGASASAKSQTLVDQIATSALGQVFENKTGDVCYDDADHRTVYLSTYGFTDLDGSYATPSSIKSTSGTNRMFNSLIYRYSTGFASTYSTSDTDSIAIYGLFEKSSESNIKNLVDITSIGTRELGLRKDPRTQLEAITFRLDNSEMPDAMRNLLIACFFGEPVLINNLPTNFFGGSFDGFIENIALRATPSYVDITLYISATDLSIVQPQWETVVPSTIIWSGVNPTLIWSNATGVLN
jgi:hypothetical protein